MKTNETKYLFLNANINDVSTETLLLSLSFPADSLGGVGGASQISTKENNVHHSI